MPQKRGEDHPGTKLTESDVRVIRLLYAKRLFVQREIAAMFDISRESVGLIVQRRRWAHVA
jgi:hypothetical protein